MFEGHEEKTRIARIANTLALSVIAILGIYTFARPEFIQQDTEAAIANAVLVLLLISQLIVIRRGQVRMAVLIITFGAWINITVQIWLFGGVHDAAFAAYMLIILVASLMVGWRGAALFLLLSILSGFIVAHAEAIGILTVEFDDPYALWLDHSLNFVIATILVSMIVTNLNQTLARARRNEQALHESEQRYRQLVKHAPAGIYEVDLLTNRFIDANDVICEYSGYSREELLSFSPLDLLTEDSQKKFRARAAKVLAGETVPETAEFQVVTKSGHLLWVLVNTRTTFENGQPARSTVVAHNITERKQTEAELERYRIHLEELVQERTAELTRTNLRLQAEIAERKSAEEQVKASLQEKEVLLKEIHHRVKNNLQVISSLLNLQSNYIEDRQILDVLEDSRHRIRSMALIHEKLYQSGNLARVDFGEYIRDLARYLFRAQSEHVRNIRLNTQTDMVYLNIDIAVPCGLVLNELITNSLKYAFPAGRSGEITVTCRADHEDQITLTVSDNGIGFPPDLDLQNTNSLGLNLVHLLTEQLGGTLRLDTCQGTDFTLAFPIQDHKVS